jgi:hypothetical protein
MNLFLQELFLPLSPSLSPTLLGMGTGMEKAVKIKSSKFVIKLLIF